MFNCCTTLVVILAHFWFIFVFDEALDQIALVLALLQFLLKLKKFTVQLIVI
jgi:hypothetical protein